EGADRRSFEYGLLARLAAQQEVPTAVQPLSLLSVAWSPKGGTVATVDIRDGVALWDASRARRAEVLAPAGRVNPGAIARGSVSYSADASWLAAVTSSGEVRLWELAGRPRLHALPRKGRVVEVAFAPRGTTLALATPDGAVWFYDPAAGREVGRSWK